MRKISCKMEKQIWMRVDSQSGVAIPANGVRLYGVMRQPHRHICVPNANVEEWLGRLHELCSRHKLMPRYP